MKLLLHLCRYNYFRIHFWALFFVFKAQDTIYSLTVDSVYSVSDTLMVNICEYIV